MHQRIEIIGNVGRDPELKYLQGGQAVCDFSVAVNETWTVKDTNEKKERTTWFRVTCWRGLAETINTHVHKGMLVFVAGTASVSSWMKDGEPQASLEVNAQTVKFLSRKEDNGASPASKPNEDEYAF